MTTEQEELLDIALLRVMDANNTRFGLGAQSLALLVNQYGFSPKVEVVQKRIGYLVGKGLVEATSKPLHPENETWRITSAGMDFVAIERKQADGQ
jgi:hypothetical protein